MSLHCKLLWRGIHSFWHLQPVRVQTADRVENAILHVVESETASSTDIRVSAMHDHSPIHSMLFNSQGVLLTANKAALAALQVTREGEDTACISVCLR